MTQDEILQRSAIGASDFPTLVSNAMNKVAAQAYQAAESPLKALARQRVLPNFKESTAIRLGEMGRLEEMTEHGEFKHTSRAEAGESMSLKTFGRAINVSRKLIIDDDLGLLGDMTAAMGQAAAQTEAEELVKLLTGNPKLSDAKAVFHATRGNLVTGSNTRAHLALSLLLYTGQRRSDVVRMGRQHVRNGVLSIVQQKTGQDVHIPLHPELKATLDRLPLDNLAFLVTAQGKPFTPAGFTNWFRAMVKEAKLPDSLSLHGLRKATCRRLAEAGCTANEIMAISGHKSLAEVTRYTVAASRKTLAEQAILALDKNTSATKTVKLG